MVTRVLLFLKFFHHVADHHHEFVLVRCTCIIAPTARVVRCCSSCIGTWLVVVGRQPSLPEVAPGLPLTDMPRYGLPLNDMPRPLLPPCQITPLSRWLIYTVPVTLFTLNVFWFYKVQKN